MPDKPEKIQLDNHTKRFMQGVTAGVKVNEAHAAIAFPSPKAQLSMFWYYVGILAVSEYHCKSQDDFEPFLLGAATRQPDVELDDE